MSYNVTVPGPAMVLSDLQARFGPGSAWKPDQTPTATAWPLQQFDIVWAPEVRQDSQLRGLWRARSARGATPVVVLAPAQQLSWMSRVLCNPLGISSMAQHPPC